MVRPRIIGLLDTFHKECLKIVQHQSETSKKIISEMLKVLKQLGIYVAQ